MTEHDSTSTRGISRRSVVKTGAHAAWAVPVVVAVSAAPAFADGSGMNVPLIVTVNKVTRTDARVLVNGTITNPTGGQRTDNLSVVINLAPNLANPDDPAAVQDDFTQSTRARQTETAGFLFSAASNPGTPVGSRNFQYFPTAGQLSPGDQLEFSDTFILAPSVAGGTASITAVEAVVVNGQGQVTDVAGGSKTFA